VAFGQRLAAQDNDVAGRDLAAAARRAVTDDHLLAAIGEAAAPVTARQTHRRLDVGGPAITTAGTKNRSTIVTDVRRRHATVTESARMTQLGPSFAPVPIRKAPDIGSAAEEVDPAEPRIGRSTWERHVERGSVRGREAGGRGHGISR
jgi:hypothetical protein